MEYRRCEFKWFFTIFVSNVFSNFLLKSLQETPGDFSEFFEKTKEALKSLEIRQKEFLRLQTSVLECLNAQYKVLKHYTVPWGPEI